MTAKSIKSTRKGIPIFNAAAGRPMTFVSDSPEETTMFGRSLAEGMRGGEIICLFGDLGSGKTTLIKGIAQGLKINPKAVNSPTFVLMNIYQGRLTLFHFDLYRLEDVRGIASIGYEEFLYGQGVSVIEWADRLGHFLPDRHIRVELAHKSPQQRLIRVSLKKMVS